MEVNKFLKLKNFSLITYYVLVVIRIVLVFIPQYGYIHPDEFFQTSEVISGKNDKICKISLNNLFCVLI